jgi:hypothetical protein
MTRTRMQQKDIKHPIMWLMAPLLYVIVTNYLCYDPTRVISVLPFMQDRRTTQKWLGDLMPQVPSTMTDAVELGGYCTTNTKESLVNASRIAQFKFTSYNQLQKYCHGIQNGSFDQTSILMRVWGMISFANIMLAFWGCVALAFFKSFLEHIIGDIIFHIWEESIEFIKKHQTSFIALGHMFAFYLTVLGTRFHESNGIFLSLLGFGLFAILFVVDALNHETGNKFGASFVGMVLTIGIFPIALIYQSALIGVITIACFYSTIGFFVACFGLGWYIGFQNEDAMTQCTIASVILMFIGYVLNWTSQIKIFYAGIYIFGAVVYYLALLIKSCKYCDNYYILSNVYMIVSLFMGYGIGTVYNMCYLSNVAITFTFLWFGEKMFESRWFTNNFKSGMFVIACIAIGIFWNLKTHPEFLMSLYNPQF